MIMNLDNAALLLQQTSTKLEHSRDVAKLKGERFNVFSVLKMETSENATHSRFLAELLNPGGSHGLKNVFLSLFLSKIPLRYDGAKDSVLEKFDFSSAKVTVERSIGKREDSLKVGGRIDIAISDRFGNNIFIENKIHAIDQNVQIERYCNYETSSSVVIYLTLYGKEPDISSRGTLESTKDFYCMSYNKDIIEWLELCYKEAAEQPMLRESIKQYILLLKKITGQLTHNKMNKDIRNLILNNLESADLISKNLTQAINDLKNAIRTGVKNKLEGVLSHKYRIKELGRIDDKNSKLWFYHKDVDQSINIHFGIEPFSGNGNKRNELFIGIIDIDNKNIDIFKQEGVDVSGWWRGVEYLKFKDSNIDLSNLKLLQNLSSNDRELETLITDISNQTLTYINKNEDLFLRICETASLNKKMNLEYVSNNALTDQ